MAQEDRRDPVSTWRHDRNMLLKSVEETKDAVAVLAEEMKEVRQIDMPNLRIEIAKLNIKAGIWGAIGGAIPIAVGILLGWLKGGK